MHRHKYVQIIVCNYIFDKLCFQRQRINKKNNCPYSLQLEITDTCRDVSTKSESVIGHSLQTMILV